MSDAFRKILEMQNSQRISKLSISPKGVYATAADLTAAIPEGDNNIYVVTADGKWYYWNGSAWVAGLLYQTVDADLITVDDAGEYFTGTNVEAVLQETGSSLVSLTTDLNEHKSDYAYLTTDVDIWEEVIDAVKTTGYYKSYWNTNEPSSAWDYYTVPCTAGDVFEVTSAYGGANARGYLVFNASNTIIDKAASTASDLIVTFTITIPANAAYVIFNNENTIKASPIIKKKVSVKQIDAAKISNMDSIIGNQNILYGKKLVCCGDSITYGEDIGVNGIAPDGKRMTYGWQIANRNGMVYAPNAVSGSTVAVGNNIRSHFAEDNGRYTQLGDNIDYLTLWFGWNDDAAIYAGEETLGTIDSTDASSYYGAYNKIIPYLINKYPYARIGLIVPFGCTVAMRQAVRNIGNKYGLGVFDNYGKGTPLYYGKEAEVAVDNATVSARQASFQALGAHPNVYGHAALSTQIEAWLRTL